MTAIFPTRLLFLILPVALASAQIAFAGDYARDPCPIPDELHVPAANYAELNAQFARLSMRSSELDSIAAAFNRECDVQNPVGSAAEIACGKREPEINASLDRHGESVDAYNHHLNDLLQAHVSAIEGQAALTREQLLRISPNAQSWQREMESWLELGQKARNEAHLHAIFAAIDTVAESEQEELKEDIAIDENALSQIKSLYASGSRFIPEEFRANLARKVFSLRTKSGLVLLLQQLSLTADRAYSLYEPLNEDKLIEGLGQFTVGVLRESLLFMDASPEAKMTVTALDTLEHSLYGWWARIVVEKRVNQLIGLQEQQLRAVDGLSRVYISQIQSLKVSRGARNALLNSACYKA